MDKLKLCHFTSRNTVESGYEVVLLYLISGNDITKFELFAEPELYTCLEKIINNEEMENTKEITCEWIPNSSQSKVDSFIKKHNNQNKYRASFILGEIYKENVEIGNKIKLHINGVKVTFSKNNEEDFITLSIPTHSEHRKIERRRFNECE